jgi:hypothetical protein
MDTNRGREWTRIKAQKISRKGAKVKTKTGIAAKRRRERKKEQWHCLYPRKSVSIRGLYSCPFAVSLADVANKGGDGAKSALHEIFVPSL